MNFEPMIVGLALPFGVDRRAELDGRWVTEWFARGCCQRMIDERRLELWTEHQFDHFTLIDQRHGRLHVWEGYAGLWFMARIPLSPRGPELFRTIQHRLLNVCCGTGVVQRIPDVKGRAMVFAYQFGQISIVHEGYACFKETWVAPLTDDALRRMHREEEAAMKAAHDADRRVGKKGEPGETIATGFRDSRANANG